MKITTTTTKTTLYSSKIQNQYRFLNYPSARLRSFPARPGSNTSIH